jgi:hypothetical protein
MAAGTGSTVNTKLRLRHFLQVQDNKKPIPEPIGVE